MEEYKHESGAKEIILNDQEKQDLKDTKKLREAKIKSEKDLTDAQIKKLVYLLARSQGII